MTQTVRETATITATPDAVWKVVGDVASVSDWVPAIESSSLEGDVRTAVFTGGGGTAHERIVTREDSGRTYTYEYLDGPLALERYVSTITVSETPDGAGAAVLWEAEFSAGSAEEEAGLRDAISGIYASALSELTSQLTA